jgi:NADH-quinone oxidoreductase subunit J
MTLGLIVFLVLAFIAVAAAVAMLFSSNTIYSALYLILNFIAIAVIYLTLGAPFVALAQITVYAGAIMVLFLFVIMMLGAEKLKEQEPLKWQRPVAVFLSLALVGEGVYALITRIGMQMLTNPST